MSHTLSDLLSPRTRLVLASAAILGVSVIGCTSSDGTRVSEAETSSRSVQASTITHVPIASKTNVLNFPTSDAATSLVQVEQVSPQEIRAGQPYTYQVKVTNLTAKPLQSVVVRSSRPDGFKTATAPDGTSAAQPTPDGALSYNVGNLGPHESRVYIVNGVASGQGTVGATYSVTCQQQMATAIPVTSPAVAVTKQGPSDVDVCQPIDWTYEVKNTGTGVARNVTLQDTLPEGLATADGGKVVAANLGDIPSGQSRSVVAHLKAAHGGKFASAAVAKSDAGEVKSNALTTNAHQPSLDLAIKGPPQEYLGKRVICQVTIANRGDAVADASTLHLVGSNARLIEVTEGPGHTALAAAPDNGAVNIGAIPAGQSRTLDATFEPQAGGVMKVDAAASARCASEVAKSSETRIMTLPALLLEAVDNQDPVKVGDNVVYHIKVTNQGSGPDSHVAVSVVVPDGEQFVSATGSSDGKVNGSNVSFAPIPTLQPKESATWDVTVKATKVSDVQFKVTATSDSVKAGAVKVEPTKLY